MSHPPESSLPTATNPNAHVRLHVCGEHHDTRYPCRPAPTRVDPTSSLGKVRQDLHDTNQALSEWMALDWYCRVSTPAWLRAAGLNAEAAAVEATGPIVDTKSARAALEALMRAVSTLANVVEAQPIGVTMADPGEMADQHEAFAGKTIDAWLT